MYACGGNRNNYFARLHETSNHPSNKVNKVCQISRLFRMGICFSLLIRACMGQVANAREPLTPQYDISVEQLKIQPKVLRHLLRAEQDFRSKRLSDAFKEVERALRIDPACAQAFTMKALLELSLRDIDDALYDSKRAVTMDANNGLSFLALATAQNSRGNSREAEPAAREALRLQPGLWQAHVEIAKSLYGQDLVPDALKEIDAVRVDFPDVHLVRGNILMRLGHRREAAVEFATFLRQSPKDPRTEQIRRMIASSVQPSEAPF